MKPLYDVDKIRIHVFTDDHPPPHYHILVDGMKVSVEIGTNRIMKPDRLDRKIEKRIKPALDWGIENKGILADKFLELNRKRH